MKERPILFSSPMVRAILAGTKTQTRRVVKPQPVELPDFNRGGLSYNVRGSVYRAWNPAVMDPHCPYGQPGDRLWVRETWAPQSDCEGSAYRWTAGLEGSGCGPRPITHYRADAGEHWIERWRPSIHMPRWASRILLEIVAIRVERLQDISGADCIAEGIASAPGGWWSGATGQSSPTPVGAYALLWESIHGPGSWAANPWVWVIEFRRLP